MGRVKTVALTSHLREQTAALMRVLGGNRSQIGHCLLVRLYDDTNVITAPTVDADELCPQATKSRSKVSQLLGLLQYIFLRRTDKYGDENPQATETIQIHCPSQILPKVPCH